MSQETDDPELMALDIESRLLPSVVVLVVIGLRFVLAGSLIGSVWMILPAIEVVLLVTLLISQKVAGAHIVVYRISVVLAVLMVAVTLAATGWLVRDLLDNRPVSAQALLAHGLLIWVTNVASFSILYWEMDRGGPMGRSKNPWGHADFLFAQMAVDWTNPKLPPNWRHRVSRRRSAPIQVPKRWVPQYGDYLYLAFTNATAFSPTDTMPMTGRAKAAMAVQALVALITVAMVFARAINILN